LSLIKPEGQVFLSGDEITHDPMYLRARKVTYLPQEPSVFRKLTVKRISWPSWRHWAFPWERNRG
jgi:lipopolysaccharide export system ATP-binding protein